MHDARQDNRREARFIEKTPKFSDSDSAVRSTRQFSAWWRNPVGAVCRTSSRRAPRSTTALQSQRRTFFILMSRRVTGAKIHAGGRRRQVWTSAHPFVGPPVGHRGPCKSQRPCASRMCEVQRLRRHTAGFVTPIVCCATPPAVGYDDRRGHRHIRWTPGGPCPTRRQVRLPGGVVPSWFRTTTDCPRGPSPGSPGCRSRCRAAPRRSQPCGRPAGRAGRRDRHP